MALKELLKQRVMEKLNFSQEISDEHLKGVIQEETVSYTHLYQSDFRIFECSRQIIYRSETIYTDHYHWFMGHDVLRCV